MSSTTLPVCPKTGSTSPSLTVPLHCSGKSGMRPMVIVFGSAARATMTAESDVDLVVVKDVSDLEAMKARAAVCLPTGHPPVHIVPATRRLLNDLRDSPSWVYGPAMAEGIVAYERGGGARGWSTRAWDRIAIPESPGERMVRILYYQREEAMDWLRKAEHDMQVVRSRDTTIGLQVRCYSAQAAAEKAIKALLVAHGQPVRAEHEAAQARRRTREDRRETAGHGHARAPGAAREVRRRSAVPAMAGPDDRR